MTEFFLHLTVPGDPVPKGRPRTDLRSGRVYTPHTTKDAEDALRWRLRGTRVKPNRTDGLLVELTFRLATWRAADIDNLLKLVLDAGNGIVWADDKQVEELVVHLRRGVPDPGMAVAVAVSRPDAYRDRARRR